MLLRHKVQHKQKHAHPNQGNFDIQLIVLQPSPDKITPLLLAAIVELSCWAQTTHTMFVLIIIIM